MKKQILMPYFQHLEPNFINNESEDSLLLKKNTQPFVAIHTLALYESVAGEKFSNQLMVRANQIVNKSTLHANLNDGMSETSQIAEPLVKNQDFMAREEALVDWVEESVSQEDVDKIKSFEFQPKVVSDVEKKQETKESTENEATYVVLNPIHENKDDIKKAKIKKKLKKKDLKFIVQPDETTSDFNSWLKNFKPIKGGHLHTLSKIEKKMDTKSSVLFSAEQSVKKSNQMVSEPLAKLLASQGHNDQAIEMYNRLILKFPEKSAYFATQIEKLKNKG
ncbi:MAG TPA: hypothetical protein PKD18_13510 [Saprospiraceae bacterium]|nr:hypothetical protein [Saprospiraceae bacterium]